MTWLVWTAATAAARPPGEILRDIEHLGVVGTVLYVAAHPDDENTRLIGWLEGSRGVRTIYLSMTRGDGGQNLIGPEQDELLGVLRVGELLAARGVDGGEQRFTRARDFGYSKSSAETLRLWGHDEVLSDVVRAIRELRPDVIVTRFPPAGETHGHHLASAILAAEAFTAAADPAFVTTGLDPWQADRLLYNRSSFFLAPGTDTSAWARADIGGYDPLTGASWGEVAARARTMHKSQGFGSAPSVGTNLEYFENTLGTAVPAGADPLWGLDLSWSRIEGAEPLAKTLRKAAERFDVRAPHRSLPLLARAHAELGRVGDRHWQQIKRQDVERLLVDCAGLWLTARAAEPAVAPGRAAKVTLTAVRRTPAEVVLHGVSVHVAGEPGAEVAGGELAVNVPWTSELEVALPADAPLTRPHWLVLPGTRNRYEIDEEGRTAPDTAPSLVARFDLTVAGARFTVTRPVEHAVTDPVAGERLRPVEVLPPVTATFDGPARMLPAGSPATTRLVLRATSGPVDGTLTLTPPPGIEVQPATVAYHLTADEPQQVVTLALSAGAGAAPGPLVVEGAFQERGIDYPHLPRRTVLQPAVQQIVPLDLARGPVRRVGYVRGPGDAVAEGLRSVGYTVEELTGSALTGDLSRFDVLVVGIRAYNTDPAVLAAHPQLMAWVAGGGRLVVQYQTNNRFDPLSGPIGPKSLTIGRGRVTDESAELTPTDPSHPVWRSPNPLGPPDFAGWVQERGLYFAETWDPAYQPLLSVHDPEEEPLLGSTVVAPHGEGLFVYTGLSFFRQLPAGVPGAYRLLANLLGYTP